MYDSYCFARRVAMNRNDYFLRVTFTNIARFRNTRDGHVADLKPKMYYPVYKNLAPTSLPRQCMSVLPKLTKASELNPQEPNQGQYSTSSFLYCDLFRMVSCTPCETRRCRLRRSCRTKLLSWNGAQI